MTIAASVCFFIVLSHLSPERNKTIPLSGMCSAARRKPKKNQTDLNEVCLVLPAKRSHNPVLVNLTRRQEVTTRALRNCDGFQQKKQKITRSNIEFRHTYQPEKRKGLRNKKHLFINDHTSGLLLLFTGKT
ncbi:hypothetical protein [Escherichia coli]|uniref:hypothetical protein n=1 Tax=Escherichia coli TaxID=562 RepID=UPI00102D891E|nr:hypothetical protein [Escherichia coli]EIX8963436.1 hypothetical protein [Escherichia coli]RZX28438.1 hypothetical protein EXX57_16950 [Escherichia coli]RZZ05104.1 hypothetical protein EXX18_14110 [Escherichia coli]TAA51496.1 hypothetical protein EXX00_20330 [Escherichia coli]